MRKLCWVGLGLAAVVLVAAAASAQDEVCTNKCQARNEKCTKAAKKVVDTCIAKADRWKVGAEKRAGKAKDPDKAKTTLETRYDKMKKACEAAQTKAAGRCAKAHERCNKACEKKATKKGK